MTIVKKNGEDVMGMVVEDTEAASCWWSMASRAKKVEIKKATCRAGRLQAVTDARGLVNILTKDEILDLIAYLESAGSKQRGFQQVDGATSGPSIQVGQEIDKRAAGRNPSGKAGAVRPPHECSRGGRPAQ